MYQYPYGDSQQLNLDWILNKLKELSNVIKNANIISPEQFGASGNGISDDTAAFQEMVNAINSNNGNVVVLPHKNYLIKSNLIITKNVALIGNDTTITFSGDFGIYFRGIRTLKNTILNNVSANSQSIALTNAADIDFNKLYLLTDETDYSWSSERAYYQKGEFVEFYSSVGNNFKLVSPLCDTYPANSNIYEFSPITVYINGINFKVINFSNNHQFIVSIENAKNSIVENCQFYGSQHIQLGFSWCYNCSANNCYGRSTDVANIGYNYGIAVLSSQHITIKDSDFVTVRHGFTVGAILPSAVNRYILFENCYSVATDPSVGVKGLDAHGDSEFVTWKNCVSDGITCAASNASIINCKFKASASYEPIFYGNVVKGYLKLIGCEVYGGDNNEAIRCTLSQLQTVNNDHFVIIEDSYFEENVSFNFIAAMMGLCSQFAVVKNSVFNKQLALQYTTDKTIIKGNTIHGECFTRYAASHDIIAKNNIVSKTIWGSGYLNYKINVVCDNNIFNITDADRNAIKTEHCANSMVTNNIINMSMGANVGAPVMALDVLLMEYADNIINIITNGYTLTYKELDDRTNGTVEIEHNLINIDNVIKPPKIIMFSEVVSFNNGGGVINNNNIESVNSTILAQARYEDGGDPDVVRGAKTFFLTTQVVQAGQGALYYRNADGTVPTGPYKLYCAFMVYNP